MEHFFLAAAVNAAWWIMHWHRDLHYKFGGGLLLALFAGLLARLS